jgi:hypothetical protein
MMSNPSNFEPEKPKTKQKVIDFVEDDDSIEERNKNEDLRKNYMSFL